MPSIVTLYKTPLGNVCAPVESSLWAFAPKEHKLGEEPESADFVIPDELDIVQSPFGKYFVVRGDTNACRLTFDALGTPLVTTPDGTMYLLERA